MPLCKGDKLGPYEILAQIGAGEMGEVYRARDPRLGRAVAALKHPHIVTIFSVEEAGGVSFLTWNWLRGSRSIT
jgi:serine/threonine protein kinase